MTCNRIRNLAAGMSVFLLAGSLACAPVRAETKISDVLLYSETTDSVVLEVHYQYDGSARRNAEIRAYMLDGGQVAAHNAFTPGRVEPGRHRTRVELSPARNAPGLFDSDGIRVELHAEGQRGAVATRTVAFSKTWAKRRTALRPPPARLQAQLSQMQAIRRAPLQQTVTPMRSRLELLNQARRQDGVIAPGSLTTPSGTTVTYSNAQPPTPPDSAPNPQHQVWASSEAERLLGIIGVLLGNDTGAINWYKSTEGGDTSPYALISKRTEAIAVMVADEE